MYRPSRTALLATAASTIAAFGFAAGTVDAERPPSADITVDTTSDGSDADPDDGQCATATGTCSIRAAVEEANASGGSAMIAVPKGDYALTLGEITVEGTATLLAKGARLDAGRSRAFAVAAAASLTVHGLDVTGGAVVDANGGAFSNLGTLSLDSVRLSGNTATGTGASGGAIFNAGTLVVSKSTLSGNAATRAGGAIEAVAGSTTTISKTTLAHNSTGGMPGNGGALHITGAGDASITQSSVIGNHADREGGGLWNGSGSMTIDRSYIAGNTASGPEADDGGGGVFNDLGDVVVTRSTIEANTADGAAGSGGGIFNRGAEGAVGSLTVSQSRIAGNTSMRAGGGIEVTSFTTTSISKSTLADNVTGAAPGNGGGLHITGTGSVEIDRSEVTGNFAANEGGGLWNSAVGTMVVTKTMIAGNASPAGPDVFNDGVGTFTIGGVQVPDGNV